MDHVVKAVRAGGEKADLHEAVAYELRGITYLPHYRNKNVFVGPGYPRHTMMRYSDMEMQLMGATPKTMMLWARGENGHVSNGNP